MKFRRIDHFVLFFVRCIFLSILTFLVSENFTLGAKLKKKGGDSFTFKDLDGILESYKNAKIRELETSLAIGILSEAPKIEVETWDSTDAWTESRAASVNDVLTKRIAIAKKQMGPLVKTKKEIEESIITTWTNKIEDLPTLLIFKTKDFETVKGMIPTLTKKHKEIVAFQGTDDALEALKVAHSEAFKKLIETYQEMLTQKAKPLSGNAQTLTTLMADYNRMLEKHEMKTKSKFLENLQTLADTAQRAQTELDTFMKQKIVQDMPRIFLLLKPLGLEVSKYTGLNFILDSTELINFARGINLLLGKDKFSIAGIPTTQGEYTSNPQNIKDRVWISKTRLIVALSQEINAYTNKTLETLIKSKLSDTGDLANLKDTFAEETSKIILEQLRAVKESLDFLKDMAFLNIAPSQETERKLSVGAMLANVDLIKQIADSVTAVKAVDRTEDRGGGRGLKEIKGVGGVLTLKTKEKTRVIKLLTDADFIMAQEFVRRFNE